MTKRKKKDPADAVSELIELADKVNLPAGYFDGDVQDECDLEAEAAAQKINNGTLMGQIEYLMERGWHPSRLKDLIENHDPLEEERP